MSTERQDERGRGHEDDRVTRPAPGAPQPDALGLAGAVGNAAMARALDRSAARAEAPRTGVVSPPGAADQRLTALLGRGMLQRGPGPATTPAAPSGADTSYQVGPNVYREDQWNVAIGEVADLWTMVGGVISKRREAVAEFCGTGGAGAAASPTIADQIVEAAITAVIAYATNGIGTALGAALGKSVTGLAKRLPVDPEIVLARGNQVVEFAVSKGKEQAKQRLGDAMKATPTPAPGGGTNLASPLAKYNSALNETLDADGRGSRAGTVQQLLKEPADPPGVRWALAAAMYDALDATLETCKTQQWNATSDGWFSMQVDSGAGELRGYDTGIVVIDLNDVFPTDALTADGAFLGGQGANAATMAPYNERPLGDIHLPCACGWPTAAWATASWTAAGRRGSRPARTHRPTCVTSRAGVCRGWPPRPSACAISTPTTRASTARTSRSAHRRCGLSSRASPPSSSAPRSAPCR